MQKYYLNSTDANLAPKNKQHLRGTGLFARMSKGSLDPGADRDLDRNGI